MLYRNTPNNEGLLFLESILDKQRKRTDLSAKETVISTSTLRRDTHTIAIPSIQILDSIEYSRTIVL